MELFERVGDHKKCLKHIMPISDFLQSDFLFVC